jgi:transposase
MTTLTKDSVIYYELVQGTTTGAVFRNFVAKCALLGHIQPGQLFIMDNARVHTAGNILQQIDQVLGQVGAQHVNLPTYSPELNPCEFVFGEMKNYHFYSAHIEVPTSTPLMDIGTPTPHHHTRACNSKTAEHFQVITNPLLTRYAHTHFFNYVHQ